MVDALNEAVLSRGVPFLGICVGAQLLATRGLERGDTPGLGWIDGEVVRLAPRPDQLPVPHMGWNTLHKVAPHPVLAGIPTGADGWHAYFVHSFHIRAAHASEVLAVSEYGGTLTAIVGRDNIIGTQFHPEKSQSLGLALIRNFLTWLPK